MRSKTLYGLAQLQPILSLLLAYESPKVFSI